MTTDQMQMHQMQAANNAQQTDALNQQLQNTSATFQQITQNVQQTPAYKAPEIANPNQSDGKTIMCIKAGIYVSCKE